MAADPWNDWAEACAAWPSTTENRLSMTTLREIRQVCQLFDWNRFNER
jgi:hypothetical protein